MSYLEEENGMDGYVEDDDDEYHEDLPNNTAASVTIETAHTFSLTDNFSVGKS